jgi:hypothetical protein
VAEFLAISVSRDPPNDSPQIICKTRIPDFLTIELSLTAPCVRATDERNLLICGGDVIVQCNLCAELHLGEHSARGRRAGKYGGFRRGAHRGGER